MKPENQIQIKRNIYSFSVVVVVLSVLITSTSWSLVNGRVTARDAVIDSLRQRTSAAIQLISRKDSIIARQVKDIDGLNSTLKSSSNNNLLEQLDIVRIYIEGAGESRDLLYHAEKDPLPIGADDAAKRMWNSAKASFGALGRKISGLESDLKLAAAGQPKPGGQKPGTQSGPVPNSASSCAINCADCERHKRSAEDFRALACIHAKNLASQGSNYPLNYPKKDKDGNTLDAKGRAEWARDQYLKLTIDLAQLANCDSR